MNRDHRSGITNDPNRPDDPQYIVRLIAQVITASLETVRIIKALPSLSVVAAWHEREQRYPTDLRRGWSGRWTGPESA